MKKKLLCTFSSKNSFKLTIDYVASFYQIYKNRIFIYSDQNNFDNLILFYNTENDEQKKLENTMTVHRKVQSDTFYTLDALNELVKLVNNGIADKNYQLDWENYPNRLLTTDKEKNLKQTYLEFQKTLYI
jgi:hypothetical protein